MSLLRNTLVCFSVHLIVIFSFTLLINVNVFASTPGITESTITIGQSLPLTGPLASQGMQLKDGANLYFKYINDELQGINGRKIKLLSLDDSFDALKAAANTKRLIEKDNVFALFGYYGTASTVASRKFFSDARVPLIGTTSGEEALRQPVNRYIFHLRASYSDEIEEINKQLTALGYSNIAIFYQNDAFGKTGLEAMKTALKKRGLQPSAEGIVQANSEDVAPTIEIISRLNPKAVIMIITSYKIAAKFALELKRKSLNPQFMVLSPVAADLLVTELGSESRGIGVAQVMPYPLAALTPISHEYRTLSAKYKHTPSYLGIEGFITAKVLVEALRRTGPELTREKLIDSLESIKWFDVGGYQINYSPTNHSGSKYTDLVVIGKDGKLIR